MDAGINNVIYVELHLGPKMANGTCGKTIVAGTIDRGSTVTHCTSTEHFQVLIRNTISLSEFDEHGSWLLQGGGYSVYNKIKKNSNVAHLMITLFL